MSQLNRQQQQAVRHTEGPLLVLAGAGSGKTLVITHKIAHLIRQTGIEAKYISAVTFTNKAAREMKKRVTKLLDAKTSAGLSVSTFHSLGLRILRQECRTLGYKPGFSIFDSEDVAGLMRELTRKLTLDDDKKLAQLQYQISRWKNALLDPEQALAEATDSEALLAAQLYIEYQKHLKAYNAVDFDDLILLPVQLFRQHPEVLGAWQERIRYLLVDEYQDTNACQYELVKCLVAGRSAFTVVGDDDQSIYTWRGAQPENLLQLQNDFPTLEVIKLEQNYRSMGRILKAANALIANNKHVFEKSLWSDLGYGEPIRVIRANDEEVEVERIVTDLRHHMFMQKNRHRDYAILYRSNHQSRLFERALREHRVPYYLSGGTSFFERNEIKTVMAYLRLLCNPDDDNAFLRIVNTPRREIGPATLERLGNYASGRGVNLSQAAAEFGLEQHLNAKQIARLRQFTDWLAEFRIQSEDKTPAASLKELLKALHFDDWLLDNSRDRKSAERRQENVQELVSWIERMQSRKEDGETLTEVVNNLSLMGMLDNQDDDTGDQVCLMTLHAAKGLEFPHVYIVGVEENILPHHASNSDDGIEEERRLAYVGITRAQRSLCLSFAGKRKRKGEWVECQASRFLQELPADDLHWEGQDTISQEEKRERGEKCLAGLRELLQNG